MMRWMITMIATLSLYVIAQEPESSSSTASESSSSSEPYLSSSSSSSSSSAQERALTLNFTQITTASAPSFVRRNAQMKRIISLFYYRDPQTTAIKQVDGTSETAFLYYGGDSFNDVWLGRLGGTTWVQLMGSTLDAPFNETFVPGMSMAYCAYRDNTLFALCGKCLPDEATDDMFASQLVTHTSAAQNWIRVNTTAWEPRQSSSCVSDGVYLYHIAGNDWNTGYDTNSVWRSSDRGVTWIQTTEFAPFSSRTEPSLVSYNSRTFKQVLYVIGGRTLGNAGLNDVWVSSDYGHTFSAVTLNAAWIARVNPAVSITSEGVIALVGGQIRQSANSNDVWISFDGGYQWFRSPGTPRYSRRYAFPSAFDANSYLYIVGGIAEENNDMWVSNVRFNNMTALSLLIYNVPNNVTQLGLQIWPSDAPLRPSTSETPVAGILIGFAVFIAIFGGFAMYKFVDWRMLPCLKHRWITETHLAMQTSSSSNGLNQQLLVRSDRASFLD